MSDDTEPTNDDVQATPNDLSPDDVSPGMCLDIDGGTYCVIDSPHVAGLAMVRLQGRSATEPIPLDSRKARELFGTNEVREATCHTPDTEVAVSKHALSEVLREAQWSIDRRGTSTTHDEPPVQRAIDDLRDALGAN